MWSSVQQETVHVGMAEAPGSGTCSSNMSTGTEDCGFPLRVMEASLTAYGQLGTKGKPNHTSQWTPLATILLHNSQIIT